MYRPLLEVLILKLEDGESRPGPTFTGLLQEVHPGVYQLSATGQMLKKAFFSPVPKPSFRGSFDGFIDPEGWTIFHGYLKAKEAYLSRLNYEIRSHLGNRNPEKAEPLLQQLVPLADNQEEVAFRWLQQGVWREWVSDFQGALDCYQEGLDCRPKKPDTRYFLNNNTGYCLNRLGRASEAEPWCRQAVEINPDYHNAHKNLGMVLEGQGRWLEAAEAFQQAIQAWPGDRRAYDHIARLLDQHPGLALDRPELQDFLDAASLVVEHARAIQAFANPEKKGPDLPVHLQLLLAAAQITRDTGRRTFSPGELRKRVGCSQPVWLSKYSSQLINISRQTKDATLNKGSKHLNWFKYQGLTNIHFSNSGKQTAELLSSLVQP